MRLTLRKKWLLTEVAMTKKPREVIEEHFSKVTDPRKDRTKEHKLTNIIVIAIRAVICA